MELRDFIVTPCILAIVYGVGYFVRPHLTDSINRKYFFPALTVKIIGAIAVGLIYQFYYSGGDTFNYHTHGSRPIWDAVMEDPQKGFRLLLGYNDPNSYKYSSRILFISDPDSFFVIRIAAFFDLFTFSTYSATAVLFASVSFFGMWLFFLAFYSTLPHLHRWIAMAAFFIPSVFFWGSGLMKDTITMACLGCSAYAVKRLFIDRRFTIGLVVLLGISFYIIFEVKKYILICFLPAGLLWIYAGNFVRIHSVVLKMMLAPFAVILIVLSGYLAASTLGQNDSQYSLNKIATTARITAYDIGFYTGRNAGSGYSLGELDGTFLGLLKLAPAGINVALFRPYLWEVRNPLMLLASLESVFFMFFSAYVIWKCRFIFFRAILNYNVLFCLVFSITFAFAVGVSTFNFGTLVRYKIPMIPFFLMGLVLMLDQVNKERKVEEFDQTEY
jgi:hypothetical protein